MYAVVGCGECSALWIVEGRPETSQCPRCGTSRQHDKRRAFLRTEDEDHAREVRTSMLATRQDEGDAFAALDSFAELDARIDDAGIDDATYLEGVGVDPGAASEAGERADSGRAGAGGPSREETVREAIRELDAPDASAVVDYAARRGVPAEWTEQALEKLVRAGEATEAGGGYRLLSGGQSGNDL
ncbi:MAG: DUF5817 domain-containing protein [Salinirussus sp.]